MNTKIVVVSDTHCRYWEEIDPKIRNELTNADISVHCGDFVGTDVVSKFKSLTNAVGCPVNEFVQSNIA